MIVDNTIEAFGDLVSDYIDRLGDLAPADLLLDRELGPEDGPLSPAAISARSGGVLHRRGHRSHHPLCA